MVGLPVIFAMGLLQATALTPPSPAYVAMGSSFAAGPSIGLKDPAAPAPCWRSRDNYAQQLARKRHLSLADRSCSGATTPDLLTHRQFGLPPQIDGLGPETELVTVTIGGNDVGYMADLGAASCRNASRGACPTTNAEPLEPRFVKLRADLTELAQAVHHRSPKAVLIFVNYVTLLPAQGGCPDKAPLQAAELGEFRTRLARINAVTDEVAQQNGARVLHASDLSLGHDLCSAAPWVNGWNTHGPDGTRWAPYHPNLAAMTAIAEALDRMLNTP